MKMTARGNTVFEVRDIWAMLTIQTKEKDHKGISHWNSQDDTSSGVPSNCITSYSKF